MTVEDLIEQLKDYDQQKEVVIVDTSDNYNTNQEITHISEDEYHVQLKSIH